jgi:putative DNA methylase
MSTTIKAPKKLIEVALPLDSINQASIREGFIYRGNPSAVHKWWAQRPLAVARAILFAQLVNDPSWKWELEHPGEIAPSHLRASWASKRKQLFSLMNDMIKWENMNDYSILKRAHAEIQKSWKETCEVNAQNPIAFRIFDQTALPTIHDPFAGGATIPLQATALGLDVIAGDLNPVAILLNRALMTLPAEFTDTSPVGPKTQKGDTELVPKKWRGAQGIAEDLRRYADIVAKQALSKVGNLYPNIVIQEDMVDYEPAYMGLVGTQAKVIAYLWARTVKSPNPAFSRCDVPLMATFSLSTKVGQERHLEPLLEAGRVRFKIVAGLPSKELSGGTKIGRAQFKCVLSGAPISNEHIKSQALAGQMGYTMLAVVADTELGRLYLPADNQSEVMGLTKQNAWAPEGELPNDPRAFTPILYGFKKWADLYLPRQLSAIVAISDCIKSVRSQIVQDYLEANNQAKQEIAERYATLIQTYLCFALDKHCMYGNSLVPWYSKENRPSMLFTQQVVQMTWDFCEVNPFSDIGGSFPKSSVVVSQALEGLKLDGGSATILHASAEANLDSTSLVISTDPPYYDNVPYADLSDFFYVWLRSSLREHYPDLFRTLLTPKADELVAAPHRHGSSDAAEAFFLRGMKSVMVRLREACHPAFPMTIYYAFRQSETKQGVGTTSTGWVTFLSAVIESGLSITGTWPVRSERKGRARESSSNALASSIVLVCRPRPARAENISRRAFLRELNQVLPQALDEMTRGSGDDRSPVAPVDLSQAIIGPGMAVFSKYSAVLEADGTPMSVGSALELINRFLAEDDFDHDSQFCLHWFEQYGWKEGRFGEADTLARAKGTSVDGVKQSGVLFAAGGIVRLLKWAEYPSDWSPISDDRLPVWETLHHLIRIFKAEGESGAGKVLAAVAAKAEATRQLAYRLYTLCERAGWAEDARAYNEIITSWSAIESAAAAAPKARQSDLFG